MFITSASTETLTNLMFHARRYITIMVNMEPPYNFSLFHHRYLLIGILSKSTMFAASTLSIGVE